MYLSDLSLVDFRSYSEVELALQAGVTAFIGANGQGKTNLVEAIGYLAGLASHRVAQDAPLVRLGAERAVIRGTVVRDNRSTLVEIEITPGRTNRARINRAPVPRPREGAAARRYEWRLWGRVVVAWLVSCGVLAVLMLIATEPAQREVLASWAGRATLVLVGWLVLGPVWSELSTRAKPESVSAR